MINEEKELSFRDNIFDIIRLYAVLQVTIGHCVNHLQVKLPDVIMKFFCFPGVLILFAISGFLVTASYDRLLNRKDRDKEYLKRRILRIFPGLWCCCLVNYICILIFYPDKPSITDTVLYFGTQYIGCNFYTGQWLRGYGVGAPNGSLWTIIVELQFYMFILIIWKWIKNKGILVWTSFLVFGIVINIISGVLADSFYSEKIWCKLFLNSLLPYLYLFLIGAFAYRYINIILIYFKDGIKRISVAAVVFVMVKYSVYCSGGYYVNVFFGVAVAIFTIVIAYVFGHKVQMPFDISYGIYLYHMIIVNILVACGMTQKLRYFIYAILGSVICGFISWYMVEKRWLERGNPLT